MVESFKKSKNLILDSGDFTMTLAGIELRYLTNNISKKTIDYYVSNIYGINSKSLLFKLHHPEKPDVLLMFSTMGLWTTSKKVEQIEINKLLKRLRSDLLRLKLTKIEQIGAERIAYLTFSGFDKEFIIIGEFFGDGNIILCNKEMKILALLHSIDVRHRKLQVGLTYTPPPENSVNIFNITQKDLEEILSSSMPTAKWIGRTLGLPTKYAEEICRMSKIDSKISGNQLTNDDAKKIFESVREIINNVVEGNHEAVIVKDDKNSDVYPIKLGNDEKHYMSVSSFMEGLDILFTETIVESGKSIQTSSINKNVTELENKLEEQTKAISIVKEKSSKIANVAKSISSLVSQGISSIEDSKAVEELRKQGAEMKSEKGIFLIKIDDEKIKINPNASLPTISSRLFDESKRQAAAIISIDKLKRKTEKKLEKEMSQVKVAEESITYSEIRKKNWYERYRWFYTSDGILAIGGRDSSSNTAIIRKHIEKNDKVFHADIHGSPFFILKNDKKEILPTSLNEIAHATVCFSRAWREAMYGLNAYWVEPEQVKKAAPSGQFLPKGSFVIEGQRNYVNISTLKLAVGLVKQNADYLISCGPPQPIKKNSICYVIIEPAGYEMVEIAKKIKLEFNKMTDNVVRSLSIDEFVRVLPAGDSHIVESGLGEQAGE
jgi:predicted ribosome quality control (RQC) complex YloA/Tae2 family protein